MEWNIEKLQLFSYRNGHITAVHTEDHLKPCVCKICGKGFEKYRLLNNHMNIHTGNKPYKCKYCGRGFADMANANMHQKTVHEGYKRPTKSKNNSQLKNAFLWTYICGI